jgi:hypothetical protein
VQCRPAAAASDDLVAGRPRCGMGRLPIRPGTGTSAAPAPDRGAGAKLRGLCVGVALARQPPVQAPHPAPLAVCAATGTTGHAESLHHRDTANRGPEPNDAAGAAECTACVARVFPFRRAPPQALLAGCHRPRPRRYRSRLRRAAGHRPRKRHVELRGGPTRRTGGGCRDKSDWHFRKTATEYDRKPGITWLRCAAK